MSSSSTLHKYLPLLECTGLIVFVAILLLPDFWMYGGTDHAGHLMYGKLIASGQLPYIDFWVHKNPLYEFSLGLWQLVFGSSWWSAKAALIATYGLFATSIYVFCTVVIRQRWLPIVAAAAGTYLALRLGFDPARNGSIMIFAISLELFALTSLFHGLSGSHRMPYFLIAGVLASCAFLTRQSSVTPFIIAVGAPFFLAYQDRDLTLIKRITRILVPFFAGAAAILLAFVVFLLVASDIGAWYDQAIVFNRAYVAGEIRALGVVQWATNWAQAIHRDLAMWILTVGGVALYLPFRRISIQSQNATQVIRFRFTYSCLIVSLMIVVAGMLTRSTYYYLPYLPYLVVLSTAALFDFIQLVRKRINRATFGVIFVILGVIFYMLVGMIITDTGCLKSWYVTASHYNFDPSQMPDQVVAREVDLLCSGDDTIYVHWNRRWVHLLSDKESANLYYNSSGLFYRDYKTPEEFQAEMLRMEESPPKVIVYWGRHPWAEGSNINKERWNDEYVKQFDEFVLSNYILHKQIPLEYTWPYYYNEPAYIFVLKP